MLQRDAVVTNLAGRTASHYEAGVSAERLRQALTMLDTTRDWIERHLADARARLPAQLWQDLAPPPSR